VQYEITGETHSEISLEIRPLMAFRDYHSTTHENTALNPKIGIEPGQITFKPYADLPTLYLAHDPAEIDRNGFWYRNFQYAIEQERGLDFAEDLFSPCALTFDLGERRRARLIASTEPHDIAGVEKYRDAESKRRSEVSRSDEIIDVLKSAADQFIVARE